MQKILIILMLIFAGICGYAYVTFPAGCAKLAGDSGRDIGVIGHAVGAAWQGNPRPGNGVDVSLQKFAQDTAHDLWQLASVPAENGAAVVAQAPDEADAPPPTAAEPPKWKGPAVMPAKPDWTWTTLEGNEYRNVKV